MTDMAPEHWELLKDLFAEAIDLPPTAHAAFAAERLSDPALQRELVDLLAHHGDTIFLTSPMAASAPLEIAGYRIGAVLGAGGMGTVYAAEQESPHRTVALKLLHTHALSPSVARRFAVEAEILARLQHPAIAQVFAAGTEEIDGAERPWFAMELVQGGVPLTTFVAREQLGPEPRLRLFLRLCDAVHHGHQKGVVHRDLKPHNVLVGGDGQPKIIDYGVARLTDRDPATMRTTAGELIGTLAYMSPEQCRGEQDSIDAQSDVYALGVMLYQLATDSLPYETAGLSLPAALRVISEATPRRAPELPGDLEAIAFRALEKDKRRRYESAAALAADVERFLRHEPVTARPPSLTYHLRLLARRHRALFAAVTVVLVVLAGATGVSSFFAVEAAARADEATGERDAAEATLSILTGALRAANPFAEQREVSLAELLDGVAARLAAGEVPRPDVQIRLHRAIGSAYRGLGRSRQARQHLEQALTILSTRPGNHHADRVDLLALIGAACAENGDLDAALAALAEAVTRIETDGEPTPGALVGNLARLGGYQLAGRKHAEARASLERAIGLATSPTPDDTGLAEANANLGTLLWQRGDHAHAAERWQQALDLFGQGVAPDHPLAVQTRSNFGLHLQDQRRFAEAEAMFTAARDTLARLRGADSPDVANAELKLGYLHVDTGDHERATAAFERAVAIRRVRFGDDAMQVPSALQGLAYGLLQQQRWAEARRHLEEALQLRLTKLPDDHIEVASTKVLLARALIGDNAAAAAEPLLRGALATRERAFGATSFRVATVQSALGHCLLRQGQTEAAEPLLRDGLGAIEQALGREHAESKAALDRLVEWCDVTGRSDEATALRARD